MYRGDKDFEPIEKHLSNFMLALAHPTRIAIVMRLAEEKDCLNYGRITGLNIKESTLESHLKALRRAGLLHCNATTKGLNYCLNWDAFSAFSESYSMIFNDFAQRPKHQHCISTAGRGQKGRTL